MGKWLTVNTLDCRSIGRRLGSPRDHWFLHTPITFPPCYPRLQTPTGSKSYCIGYNLLGINADQGRNTLAGGNTINSALRRKCCGENSLTLFRPRWRCAIIVLHLRVSTALATFLRLLYPLTPFSMLKSYFAPLMSRDAVRLWIYISQRWSAGHPVSTRSFFIVRRVWVSNNTSIFDPLLTGKTRSVLNLKHENANDLLDMKSELIICANMSGT
jgi:hypothetical protein